MSRGRPTHRLTIKRKEPGSFAHSIGAAWMNDSGAVTIVLNPGVVLSHRDCEDHYLGLWPNERHEKTPRAEATSGYNDRDEADDEIPF